MTTARRRLAAVFVLSAYTGAPLAAAGAESTLLPPYRAALIVQWGQAGGSDAFRADFSAAAGSALAARCFSGIAVPSGDRREDDEELTLTVVLSDMIDEIRYDDSIAAALQPGEPTQELRRVARLTIKVDAQLTVSANDAVVAEKRFAVHAVRRPLFIGEDPQQTVRAQAIESGVRALLKAVGCGTGKLDRRLRRAFLARGSAAGSR